MGSSNQPISPTTQILNKGVASSSDSNGNATWTFPSPPSGMTWTGTLTCSSAPGGAVFTVSVGATNWGTFGGNSVFGPVQLLGQGSDQLVVNASGLTPSTTYEMYLLGSSDGSINVAPIWPDPTSSALTAQFIGGASDIIVTTGTALTSTNSIIFNAPLSVTVQGVGVVLGASASTQVVTVTVANATTGQSHTLQTANTILSGLTVGNNNEFYFPVVVASGQTLLVEIKSVPNLTTGIQVIGYNYSPSIMIQNTPNGSFDVVEYGGSKSLTGTFVSGTNANILNVPPSGFAYRLHAMFINGNQTYGGGGTAIIYGPAGVAIGSMVIVNTAGGTTVGSLAGYTSLGGQLATGVVSITAIVGLSASIPIGVTYDIVAIPAIS